MATPLTDSINALTTYANEVTGASDTNLSDAVHTLASGYGGGSAFNPLEYALTLKEAFMRANNLPETVEFDFTGNTNINSLQDTFAIISGGIKHLTIKGLVSTSTTFNMAELFYANSSIQTVEFKDCSFSPQRINRAFNAVNLTDIIGEIDLTNVINTAIIYAFDASKLKEVRIKQNSLSLSFDNHQFTNCPLLSDDSIISVANGLNADAAGNTIALHSTPKARCSTLMGNNDNGTFVADENGTMSLADFIANVKGWTLA